MMGIIRIAVMALAEMIRRLSLWGMDPELRLCTEIMEHDRALKWGMLKLAGAFNRPMTSEQVEILESIISFDVEDFIFGQQDKVIRSMVRAGPGGDERRAEVERMWLEFDRVVARGAAMSRGNRTETV